MTYRANTFHGGITLNRRRCSWLRFLVSWEWDILCTSWCGHWPSGNVFGCCNESRDGIHESTISLMFLSIYNLEISSTCDFYLRFAFLQKTLFINTVEFSLLVDCFGKISGTIGVVWFSVSFSSFPCISNYCFQWRKDVLYINKV